MNWIINNIVIDDMISGVVAGLIATIVFLVCSWLWKQLRFFLFIWLKFYGAKYLTYRKNIPDNEVQEIVIEKVRGNKVFFSGDRTDLRRVSNRFYGKIIFNPKSLKTGEGYYTHKNSKGFAFIQVIIKDKNTLYVEAPFTLHKKYTDKHNNEKEHGVRRYQAFIWEKVKKKI